MSPNLFWSACTESLTVDEYAKLGKGECAVAGSEATDIFEATLKSCKGTCSSRRDCTGISYVLGQCHVHTLRIINNGAVTAQSGGSCWERARVPTLEAGTLRIVAKARCGQDTTTTLTQTTTTTTTATVTSLTTTFTTASSHRVVFTDIGGCCHTTDTRVVRVTTETPSFDVSAGMLLVRTQWAWA